jgi:hypothetical protein
MYYIDEKCKNHILNKVISKIIIGNYYFPHGTFANIIDPTLISDIDIEDFMEISSQNPNQKERLDILHKLVKHIENLDSNIVFLGAIFGVDERFYIDYNYDRRGHINFNKDAYIKKSTNNIIEKIKDIKTVRDFYIFREKMEEKALLKWDLNSLEENKLKQNGKEFTFTQFLEKVNYPNPIILQYAYEYKKDIWIPIDDSVLIYTKPKKKMNFPKLIPENTYRKFRFQVNLINETNRLQNNLWIYEAIYKNLAQCKWLKSTKRLRTLITHILFYNYPNSIKKINKNTKNKLKMTNKEIKDELFGLRKYIKEQTSKSDLAKLNQIKNRLDLYLILSSKKIPNLGQFGQDIINDLITKIKDIINKNSLDLFTEVSQKLNKYLLFDLNTIMNQNLLAQKIKMTK